MGLLCYDNNDTIMRSLHDLFSRHTTLLDTTNQMMMGSCMAFHPFSGLVKESISWSFFVCIPALVPVPAGRIVF